MKLLTVPNLISFCRIVLSFSLLISQPLSLFWIIIYFSCGFSDLLDGFLARKLNKVSPFGATLDTIADVLFYVIVVFSIFYYIDFALYILVWLIVIVVVKLSSMAVVVKNKISFELLHTKLNKVTGIILFICIPFINTSDYIQISLLVICSTSAIIELKRVLQIKKSHN